MIRLYTPADTRKSLRKLYSIDSIQDYIRSIANLDIDIKMLNNVNSVHEDYAFAEEYICDQIEAAKRIVFLGVYDLAKEAYFLKKFPNKKFVVGDVSIAAIKSVPDVFENVTVVEATSDDFVAEPNDLIIANLLEIYLTQSQIKRLLMSEGVTVIFNNAHVYFPSYKNKFYWIIREIRAAMINLLSTMTGQRQWQFRGWWRTVDDFIKASESTDKCLKAVIFNKRRGRDDHDLYSAMIHYDQC